MMANSCSGVNHVAEKEVLWKVGRRKQIINETLLGGMGITTDLFKPPIKAA